MAWVASNPAAATESSHNWSDATIMNEAIANTTSPVTTTNIDLATTTDFCPYVSSSSSSASSVSGGSGSSNTLSGITASYADFTRVNGKPLNASDTSAFSPHFKLEQYVINGDGTATVRITGYAGKSDNSKAKANLVATIPVSETQNSVSVTSEVLLPATFPSLWVKVPGKVDPSDEGLTNVYSDVLGPCDPVPSDWGGVSGNTLDTGRRYVQSPVSMPAAPSTPGSSIVDLGSNITSALSLPRDTDISSPTNLVNGRYQYKVSEIDWQGGSGQSLTFKPGYKVTLFVEGNINPKNKTIRLDCAGTTGCNATDAMIVGNASSGTLNMQGNPEMCNLFVWAPNYDASLGGGGTGGVNCEAPADASGGASSNRGIYWVKTWNSNSAGVSHVAFSDQSSTLWNPLIAIINSLQPNSIPSTTTTTVTYTVVSLGGPRAWGTKAANYVVSVPSSSSSSSSVASSSSSSSVASSSSSSSVASSSSSSSVASSSSSSSVASSSSSSSSPTTVSYSVSNFAKNGGSGTITVNYANADNLVISTTKSGDVTQVSPSSNTVSGTGSFSITFTYPNGNTASDSAVNVASAYGSQSVSVDF